MPIRVADGAARYRRRHCLVLCLLVSYPSTREARIAWIDRTAYQPEAYPKIEGPAVFCKPTGPCLVSLGRTGTGRCFIEFDVTNLRFAIVGAGRLGASMGRALRACGLTLVGYTALTASGRTRAEDWLGGHASTDLSDLVARRPDLYLLTVPDSALAEVAASLGDLLPPDSSTFVAHTSGVTSVEVLAPCAAAGAVTFAFHPLQTFPDPETSDRRFPGSAVAVTPSETAPRPGGQPGAAQVGFALARLLGARPFVLADSDRTLYHAAATIACNYFVTLEHVAQRLFTQAGLPPDDALAMFLPLVRATLDNIEAHGAVDALTGPLSRGDVGTIEAHLSALAQDAADTDPLYRVLGLATLELVRGRGQVDDATIARLTGLLKWQEG